MKNKIKENKKAGTLFEDFIKILLWIIFFVMALLGVYYLIRKIGV